jgi:Mce-associated membrane protein
VTHQTPDPEGGSIRHLLIPATLVIVLVALVATSAVLWLRRPSGVDQGPLVAAQQEAVNFFSLDYRHAEQDIDRVLAQATGTFKEQYAAKRSSLSQQIVAGKLAMTATVPEDGAAIEYLHDDRAQVLVAVDVTTKVGAKGAKGSEQSRYRTRVGLSRVGDTWLINAVNQVG